MREGDKKKENQKGRGRLKEKWEGGRGENKRRKMKTTMEEMKAHKKK